MTYQTEMTRYFSPPLLGKLLILSTLPLLLLVGCGIHRMPQLLSQSETANAKPKIQAVLDRNAESLGEDVAAVKPIQLTTCRQTNEILPYECWELSVVNQNMHNSYLLWKIYSTVDDALAEQNNILNKLAKYDVPIPLPIIWDKALPYAKAPSVLIKRPVGITLPSAIAWKVSHQLRIDGHEYDGIVKRLVELHSLATEDTADMFPIGSWLRQMAEVGVTRKMWSDSVRDQLLVAAKEWKTGRVSSVHGDISGQSIWVDSTFTVTAIMDWEKLGSGDPVVDLGYLLADATIIQPFEMRERYGVMLPEEFSGNTIGKTILQTYRKETHTEFTSAFIANVRAAYLLRIVETYLYQHEDPLLQVGMARLHQFLPEIVASDPIAEMAK